MKTDELIRALAADQTPHRSSLAWGITGAALLGSVVAGALFALLLAPRPDLGAVMGEPRFAFKFLVTLLLAASSFMLGLLLARPAAATKPWWFVLGAVPVLLALAVLIELSVLPRESWMEELVGSNSILCLVSIPLLATPVLAVTVASLRRGAPLRPGVAGAVAGLFAGGLGAALYATHCVDDSPLFVTAWYSLAIAIVVLFGTLAGWKWLRW